MDRDFSATISSPKPFLELHFYKGGLRTEFSAETAERPNWAPAPETVGYRDEITLGSDDLVIEIAKFENGANVVTWVGVYENSPDQIYGDRRNHVGLGVWLFNQVPSEPALLVEGLAGLLKITAGSPEDFKAKGGQFIQEFMKGWLTSYCQLPAPLGGLSPSSSPVLDWIGLAIDRETKNNENAINEAFFQMLYLPTARPSVSRALILLTDSVTAKAALSGGFEKLKAKRLGVDFLGRLPEAFTTQGDRIEKLEKQLGDQIRENEDLHQEVDRLQIDLTAEGQDKASVERDLADLRGTLEGNDEIRRHETLIRRLTETNQAVQEVLRELANSRSQITRTIQEQFSSLQHRPAMAPPATPRTDFPKRLPQPVSIRHSRWYSDLDWGLIILVIAVIAAIFAFGLVIVKFIVPMLK